MKRPLGSSCISNFMPARAAAGTVATFHAAGVA